MRVWMDGLWRVRTRRFRCGVSSIEGKECGGGKGEAVMVVTMVMMVGESDGLFANCRFGSLSQHSGRNRVQDRNI